MLAQLHTSEEGLSQREADARRATYGSNTLKRERNTALGILGRQFKSSLIYLLVFASVFSFFLGDLSDGIIIAVILLINTLLGFFQEYRSERAVAKLSQLISKRIAVKRDGAVVQLDETLLVPGDVVLLREGDIVPADCTLLASEDLQVNVSQLTGESLPVAKDAWASWGQHAADSHTAVLFAGSVIEKARRPPSCMLQATLRNLEKSPRSRQAPTK